MAEEKKDEVVQKPIPKKKASKPVMPSIYEDGNINMHSSMITTKEEFIKLFKGTKAGRGVDLSKAWDKAKKFRDKHK